MTDIMERQTISSFPPIVDDGSRVLVLGSMPGAESLRQQRYYAYEQNHFWKVVFALYGLEKPADYESRVRFLHEKRIALWDVVATCVRPGSADADIRRAAPNRIAELLESHPQIGAVFLNGNGAAKLFKRLVLPEIQRSVGIETLPSTSPAYAIPFERKLEGWRKLTEFLSKIM
jgi:TDG/mug DNA glycosylase family protein